MPDINPPPAFPVRSYQTPSLGDGYYTELIDITASDYVSLKRGIKYSDIQGAKQEIIDLFPDLFFLRETQQKYPYAIRLWATDRNAEASYNAEVTYLFESVPHPGFTRAYTVRRDVYEANPSLPTGQPLTVLLGVKITAGGTGYTVATGTFAGPGTGAEIQFVISDGVIISAIVTKEGTGFDDTSTITIIGDGAGATATLIIQPATAILAGQKKEEFPEDHPLHHEFVRVLRVYETIPGVVLKGQEWDREFDFGFPYIKQIIPANTQIGDFRKEITPIDSVKSEMRTVNVDALLLSNILLSFPGVGTVKIPDFLTDFTEVAQESTADSNGSEDVLGGSVSGSYSYTIPLRTESQSSAVFAREIVPTIIPFYGQYRDTTNYMFLLPMPVTRQQVIDRLQSLTGATLVSWPVFSPRHVTIVIITRRVSLRTNASYSYHRADSDSGNAAIDLGGTGSAREIGMSIQTIRVPPTIHGDLTGTITTGFANTADITVSSDITGVAFPQSISETDSAWTYVFTQGLEATPGATTLPSSGLLITDVSGRPYKYGTAMFHVEVINAADI